jgi:ABC-type uncharacterized transport system YnjBCD substrate-binding protein
MKNIEATESPSMAEAETYWKSLWGEKTQHNETAEWIRREQKRKIKYKITGLNLSQLPTGILKKTLVQ